MHRIKIDGEIFFAENGEKISDILIKNNLSYFTEKAEYIDLSEDSYFSQSFINNMNFK